MTQAKVLRVLEEGIVEMVGGSEPIRTDVRIIAATNKDLQKEMEQGQFREDLYFRLDVVRIVLPPLRKRTEDIRLLADHFMKKYASERTSDVPVTGIDPEVLIATILILSW